MLTNSTVSMIMIVLMQFVMAPMLMMMDDVVMMATMVMHAILESEWRPMWQAILL